MKQSASLIACLPENDVDALATAWTDMVARGPDWRSRASQGRKALKRRHPDLDLSALAG